MKNLKHIAFFLPSLAGGGAERQIVNLANVISKQGYIVDLVAAEATGPYLKDVSGKVRIVNLHSRHVSLALPGLIRYLRRHKPDILFSAMDHANCVALLANLLSVRHVKVIVSARVHLSASIRHSRLFKDRIIFYFNRVLYRTSAKVVAISNEMINDLVEFMHLPKELTQLIYNPAVTAELFYLSKEEITNDLFQKDKNVPVILSAGRLEDQKNYACLIRAFAILERKFPARLVILGEGSLRNDLLKLIKELHLQDKVILLGFVENPYKYMKNCDLFVLPSKYEGLPGALIEALALAPRIVATNSPGGSAEILKNGKYGKLAAVDDAEDLADCMLESLQGKPQKPDSDALDRFKAETIAEEYLQLFKEVYEKD